MTETCKAIMNGKVSGMPNHAGSHSEYAPGCHHFDPIGPGGGAPSAGTAPQVSVNESRFTCPKCHASVVESYRGKHECVTEPLSIECPHCHQSVQVTQHSSPNMSFSVVDQKWIDALRRFIGFGLSSVPVHTMPDGSVNAVRTLEAVFGLHGIVRKEAG